LKHEKKLKNSRKTRKTAKSRSKSKEQRQKTCTTETQRHGEKLKAFTAEKANQADKGGGQKQINWDIRDG